MSEKTIYVQNLRKYETTYTVTKEVTEDGTTRTVRDHDVVIGVYKADPMTGAQLKSGYTEITQSDFDRLVKTDRVFAGFVADEDYVAHDTLPADALIGDALNAKLASDVTEANGKVVKLTADLDAANKRIEELESELAAAKASGGAL